MTHGLLLDADLVAQTPGVVRLQALDEGIMRSCAQNIRINYLTGELDASTVNTYYTAVRACLS